MSTPLTYVTLQVRAANKRVQGVGVRDASTAFPVLALSVALNILPLTRLVRYSHIGSSLPNGFGMCSQPTSKPWISAACLTA